MDNRHALRFQAVGTHGGKQLRQTLRLPDHAEPSARAQDPSCRGAEIPDSAGDLVPGDLLFGMPVGSAASGTQIGGIGDNQPDLSAADLQIQRPHIPVPDGDAVTHAVERGIAAAQPGVLGLKLRCKHRFHFVFCTEQERKNSGSASEVDRRGTWLGADKRAQKIAKSKINKEVDRYTLLGKGLTALAAGDIAAAEKLSDYQRGLLDVEIKGFVARK